MNTDLPTSALRRIDAACDAFEADWLNGHRPRVESYLSLCSAAERPRLLDLLQQLQEELRHSQRAFDSRPQASAPSSPRATESNRQTEAWDPPRVILRVVAGPHEDQEFIYEEYNTLLVGRSGRAQLRLKEDMHFSRYHFRLEANPPVCYVMDLNSRNGTFVNGERITERFLNNGDIISGGRTKMVVSIRNQDRPIAESAPKPVTMLPVPKTVMAIDSVQLSASSLKPVQDKTTPIISPHRDSGPAFRIRGYEIHERLGSGDLGTVYRATRLSTQEDCALKILSHIARADEKSIQSFLREASILHQLQHQHVVRMIEIGASGSELFLSTEYVSAIVWDRLSARWAVPKRIRIACGIMAQILGALAHAHACEMVHRDVKPGNILISRSNGKLLGKLADFGVAKHYTSAGMSQMTREGDVIGSLPFMSPEQFINSREARPGCDLYSAGATLYWMISGRHPIPLENHPCKFLAILDAPPVCIREYCPEVPSGLAQIIDRSLEKSPAKRFTSAAEMRHHIRRYSS